MKHANSETLCTVLSLFSVPDGQNVAHVYPYTQIWCCLDELSVHASSRCCYAMLLCCIVMDACLVQRANRHMPQGSLTMPSPLREWLHQGGHTA